MKRFLSCLLLGAVMLSASACSGKNAEKKGETATLTWLVPGEKQTDIASVMESANKIIEPKIGAKLDLQFIDDGAFSERMTMNMASGANFDLCFTGYINKYATAVRRGGLIELDELIEKETTSLKSAIPEYFWQGAKIDGKIYAVPNVQTIAAPSGVLIEKKYADKYNLDVNSIKTMNDLEPFFEKIKANEPNVYAYRPNYGIGPWTSPMYEEMLNGIVAIKKDGSDTKAVLARRLSEVKDAGKKMREWYLKGYIRPDVASAGDDSQDMKIGKYVSYQANLKPDSEINAKIQYGRDYVCAPIEEPYVNMGSGTQTMIGISRTSKNSKASIKFIELMNTDKALYNLISYGIENKHYTLENNKVKMMDNGGYAPKAAWKFGNQFNAILIEGQSDTAWERTEKQNNEAVKSPLMGLVINTDNIVNEISQVTTLQNEYGVLANGSDDPDKYYDEFLSRMDAAGQEKILAEVQRQIDEFLKK